MRREFQKSTLREYFESIVIAVILALFIRTFVVQAFKIPTGSMENNLLIGDHLLVNKFVFAPAASRLERTLLPMSTIRRGDVVVFPDRIVASHPEGVREIPVAGIRRVARQKKVFTGLRLIIDADAGRLEIRALTPANAATAQRIIAGATRDARA